MSEMLHSLSKLLVEKYNAIIGVQPKDSQSVEKIIEHIVSYYEGIINCMPGNVYWLDKNCITLGCNKNVLDMFGFKSMEEFKGLTFEEMGKIGNWLPKATQSFKKDTLDVINTGKAKLNVEELPIPHYDGGTIHFLSSRVPLFDHTGAMLGVVGISIDITDRKRMEAELKIEKNYTEAASRAKTEFLENMRHDIRTPLTGITGFASIIKEESNEQKIKEYADNLVASSNALLEFLNEILETVRIAAGETPLLKNKFDLRKRLTDVICLNQSKAKQKQLDLNLDYDSTIPPYLIGDSKRVQRIVLELVTNALNFTDKGSVKVSAQLAQKTEKTAIIKIVVSDTGIGIPRDKQQEIFARFKRLTPSYEGVYKGAGLGLAVVKQFIDDIDGEIYVNSSVGEGTVFTCVIPLKEALLNEDFGTETMLDAQVNTIKTKQNVMLEAKQESSQQCQCYAETKSLSYVLVVEDNPIASKMILHTLSNLNCRIDHVADGLSAVMLAEQKNYEMIFMDVGLPNINGLEVTKRIRINEWNKDNPVPIIALTAHVDVEGKQCCIEAGMNAVLSKPLLRKTASDILNAFIPGRASSEIILDTNHAGSEQLALIGSIIDYEAGLELTGGNEELLKELIAMLITLLSDEIRRSEQLHHNNDWNGLCALAHKLKGGAMYCGAIRLQEACARLEHCLKSSASSDRVEFLYQQMIDEMHAVRKYELSSDENRFNIQEFSSVE